MHAEGDVLHLTATDLVGHLNCRHLTTLDIQVAAGHLENPHRHDPLLDLLRERGHRHEAAFVAHLAEQGLAATVVDGVEVTPEAVAQTRAGMAAGAHVIVQAALREGRWSGRADILRRVETPSALGPWSYEPIDTKLARETKGGAVLQLCLYADLLAHAQGAAPEQIHVVAPCSNYQPQSFRLADFAAFYRRAKAAAEAATVTGSGEYYPDPNPHCDVCRWSLRCDRKRRDDDHLCLVAGITSTQIAELQARGIGTATALAQTPLPLAWKPHRGSPASYEKAREQARLQVETRQAGRLLYEMLPIDPAAGLCLLPEPSPGDVFFDLEGDPFVGEHGLEYLFGYQFADDAGEAVYRGEWALDRQAEKASFESFIDFVVERRRQHPDLHIYHYAPYEPAALKRLMGRYGTRQDEVDDLLREHVFVDLYSVVRNAARAGVESYSIKKLEPLYAFQRRADLADANVALAAIQAGLELGDAGSIALEQREVVEAYNRDDCASACGLRDWLEERRAELVASGVEVPRPRPDSKGPSEDLRDELLRVQALVERLTADVPVDAEARTPEQQGRWILAHLLDWHRREDKATWWELFRLRDLTPEERMDERAAVSGLVFEETVAVSPKVIPTHRYRFPQQETELRGGESLRAAGGQSLGKVGAISVNDGTIDIKKSKATANIHPAAVFAHDYIPSDGQRDSLFRIGEYVAEHGIKGDGEYQAARALLLREPPRLGGQPVRMPGEDTLDAALRVASVLEPGVFPIQGPPGTGKS